TISIEEQASYPPQAPMADHQLSQLSAPSTTSCGGRSRGWSRRGTAPGPYRHVCGLFQAPATGSPLLFRAKAFLILAIDAGVVRGIRSAGPTPRRRKLSPPDEEPSQDGHGIREVDRPVVIRVGGVWAGGPRLAQEEPGEDRNGIREVDDAVRVRVASLEA